MVVMFDYSMFMFQYFYGLLGAVGFDFYFSVLVVFFYGKVLFYEKIVKERGREK